MGTSVDEDCCRFLNESGSSKYKPEMAADWILMGFTVFFTIPFVVANGVVFVHRKRKYFQASGWTLILGSSAAGLIWIAAALVVNEHFRRDKVEFFSYCGLWTFWFQLTFGICGWLTFMALRLYYLYKVCTAKRPKTSHIWLVFLPLLLAPAVIFSIVATVERVSHHPWGCKERCRISNRGWRFSTFLVLPPVYFSIIIALLIRVRKQADFLLQSQYHHTKESAIMGFVLYLLTGTTYWSNRQSNVEGRCFLTFCVCSLVFIRFWIHTGWPIYICLFKRGDAMDKYEEELRRHGAICLQRVPPLVGDEFNSSDVTESFTFDGQEAIIQAIAAEQAKKDDLKIQKEHLHRRITQLKTQLEELNHQNTVSVIEFSSSFMTNRETEKVVTDSNQITRHLSLELRTSSSYAPGGLL